MIRVERDPAFWDAVAGHPMVAAALRLAPGAAGAAAGRGDVLPLAAAHGGFLFFRRDPPGFAWELHTLFTPAGWGREAWRASGEAARAVWGLGGQTILTFETADNRRSRPPTSFGFRPAGDFRDTPGLGPLRQWVLTRAAWDASPAGKRRADPCG